MRQVVLFIFFIFSFIVSFAQEDKIYTSKGIDFHGEFKSLEDGVVIFKTEFSDYDFKFKMSKITGIIISKEYIITTIDEKKYIGTLISLPAQNRVAKIKMKDGTKIITLDSIDAITSVDKDFINRFTFSANAGFTFTKAENVRQRAIAASIIYDSDKLNIKTAFSTEGTKQDDVEPIRRTEGNFSMTRDLWGRVKLLGGIDLLSNTEQSLDLRSTIRTGLGGYFIRKSKIDFLSGAGIAYNNERYGGDEPVSGSSLEGFALFRLNVDDIKSFSFVGQVIVYPSIFTEGRFRVDSDIALRYDLPFNLFVEMNYTHDLDNSPLADTSEFDYVFKTTLGWKWN